MDNQQDRNYVSIGFWMLALFLMAIPCVGWVMIIVWAFAGENESRKNYFKALLLWTVILIGIVAALAMVGTLPEIMRRARDAMPK